MMEILRHLLISTAYALPADLNPNTSECNSIFFNGGYNNAGAGFTCIAQYIENLTLVFIAFAASISLIMLMVNGFRWMLGPATVGGSTDAAKKGIIAALVGLGVSLLTYVILDTVVQAVTN